MNTPVEAWSLVKIFLLGGFSGVINVLFFMLVMNELTSGNKSDEVAINTYVLNFFVGWMFFSVWFLMRADEEWKKVAKSVIKNDQDAFNIEAPKRIPLSVRLLYFVISLFVVLSFHLFHIESTLALVEIQFGIGFFVVTMLRVLLDLDDPLGGVINVPDVPSEWMKELKQ